MNMTPINRVDEITPITRDTVRPVTNDINLIIPSNGNGIFRSDEAFMNDIIRAFENFGLNISANLALNNNTSLEDSTHSNITQALENFVHNLQAVLNQIQTPPTEPHSENPPIKEELQTGFMNFIKDLNFLLSSSSNTELDSSFNSLVGALIPNSTNTENPKLSEFLNMMLINLNNDNNNQNSIGTSFSAVI